MQVIMTRTLPYSANQPTMLYIPFVLYRILGRCTKLAADGARSPEIIQAGSTRTPQDPNFPGRVFVVFSNRSGA